VSCANALHVGAVRPVVAIHVGLCQAPTIDAANNASAISVFTFGFSFFWLMFWVTHQEDKKTPDLHQAAEASVEIFSFGRLRSRTSTLSGQGTLPSPTTGSRIRLSRISPDA
jgi:hypothetical protein